MTGDLLALGDEDFVALTTFRRSGVAVPTTVWIARDGDALIVTTNEGTGKVKRIRNNSRVEVRPSGRLGKVADDAPMATGRAEVLRDEESAARLREVFLKKYGMQFRIAMRAEDALLKNRGKRIVLRITPE